MIDENDDRTVTLTGCTLLATILATASTQGFAQQQPALPPPTATEVFALRDRLERLSTCAQLAKKILDTRGGHSADWGDPVVDLRYDPATDHCYIEMVMVSPPNLWGGGRTLELLATTTISQNGQRRFGTVFANHPNYKHTLPSADNGYGFDDADDYINRLMYGKR